MCYTVNMETKELIPNETFSTSYIDELSFSDIQVIGLGYEKTTAEKYPFSAENLRHYSLHFVLSGVGYYETENRIYRLPQNCLFLLYPNSNIKYYPDKKRPWTYVWINFTGSKALEFIEYTSLTPDTPVCSFKSPKIGKMLLRALQKLKSSTLKDFTSLHYFYNVVNEIIQSHPTANVVSKKKEDHTTLALQYLNENYPNPDLTLKTLSDHLHLNPSYLSRILKQRTGVTFTDFLTSLRIQTAIKLMEEGNIFVNEIARKVGFSDPYYFSKTFKKYAHSSPKSYIKELEERAKNATLTPEKHVKTTIKNTLT